VSDTSLDGAQLIVRERARQIAEEGWTYQHDDGHRRGELADAAACYAMAASVAAHGVTMRDHYGVRPGGVLNAPSAWLWPFEQAAWKPSDDPVRNLVKAGALIAAEIDRLRRQDGSNAGRMAEEATT
jgi:hypothetical protein